MISGDQDNGNLMEDFNDFFENSLCGFVLTTPEGKIIKANQTLKQWIGTPGESMEGRRFSDLLSMGGKIFYETHLRPLLHMQGYFDEVSLELSGINNSKFPVLANALKRKNGSGQAEFITISLFKGTDRKIYEQNLKDSKADLEISLANAREKTVLREQLIGILGHDLRNPLGSIVAAISLLSHMPLTEPQQKIMEVITRSSYRMSELITNILDFARTRLGEGIIVNRQKTNIEPLLQQVIDELQSIYPARRIVTDFSVEEEILCDGSRVSQLFSNLLANALTHGDQDTAVDVKTSITGDKFELSVSNTGHQIPGDILSNLFKPFTREEHQASANGLGLGLYIASQIAKAHKGELLAKSTPELTTFTFRMSNI